jgi:hypothetical protein
MNNLNITCYPTSVINANLSMFILMVNLVSDNKSEMVVCYSDHQIEVRPSLIREFMSEIYAYFVMLVLYRIYITIRYIYSLNYLPVIRLQYD